MEKEPLMYEPPFSMLENHAPSGLWQKEVSEFSTWLSEPQGIALLSAITGIELIFEASELRVKSGFADLVFKVADFVTGTATADRVVVECSMNKVDDDHFNRMIVYTAELNAAVGILVGPKFASRHIDVINGLNAERDARQPMFYALQLGCKRYYDRSYVELYNVSSPNGLVELANSDREQQWVIATAKAYAQLVGDTSEIAWLGFAAKTLKIPSNNPDLLYEIGKRADITKIAIEFAARDNVQAEMIFEKAQYPKTKTEIATSLPEGDWQWQDRRELNLPSRIFGSFAEVEPVTVATKIIKLDKTCADWLNQPKGRALPT